MKEQEKPAAAVRVGLIGYGFAGRTFHAPLLQSVPGLALTVVGSSRPDAVRAALPGVNVCAAAQVTNHPELDLVVIATPNQSHYPLAAGALRAGKDVVVDKPFTITLAEARALREIAIEAGRTLSVFHNRRWDSEILATAAALDSGMLGEVAHYECHMDRFRPKVRRRWREDTGQGAGLWFDLGPHLIDQAVFLFGPPQAVLGSFATLREGGETEDWAHVQLIYDRLRVVLHATLLGAGSLPRSVLQGTRGSWVKYGADTQEQQLMAGMLPLAPGFGTDPVPGIFYDGVTSLATKVSAPVGNQRAYYVGIRDAVRERSVPPVTVHDAVAVMAVLEASFASGREGRVLPVPLTEAERAAVSPRVRDMLPPSAGCDGTY